MRQKRTGQKIWKGNVFRRRLGAGTMVLLFILGMFFDQSSLMRVQAEEDSISVGTIRYDEDGVGYFSDATGTGTSLYHSIVISFTKQVSTTKTEQMLLPSVPGFVYQSNLSSPTSSIINMPNGKTAGEIANYISQVQFKNVSDKTNGQNVDISINSNVMEYKTFYFAGTEHYYQYVRFTGSRKDWVTSYNLAKEMYYNGQQGYLATVTSQAEDEFIYSASQGEVGWLGGSRLKGSNIQGNYYTTISTNQNENNNYWVWMCGPEIGQVFFTPAYAGTTATYAANSGHYINWDSGTPEPNGSGSGECCLTTLPMGTGYSTSSKIRNYSWNDISNTVLYSSYGAQGFFVEYGDKAVGNSSTVQSSKSLTVSVEVPELSHSWTAVVRTGDETNVGDVYCVKDDPKCSYYGTTQNHEDALPVTLSCPDHVYDRNPIPPATVLNKAKFLSTVDRASVGEITYYSGAYVEGDPNEEDRLLTTRPKDVGLYYAKVDITYAKASTVDDTKTLIAPFIIYLDEANYQQIQLSNTANEEQRMIHRVSGDGSSDPESVNNSDLEITVTNPNAQVKLYQIGSVSWNDNNQDYDDPVWVSQVQTWLDDPEHESFNKTVYRDPKAIGNLSERKEGSFYRQLLAREGNIIDAEGEDKLPEFTDIQPDDPVIGYRVDGDETSGIATYTYHDLPFGIYAVMGVVDVEEGATADVSFSPVIIAILPETTGTTRSFYVYNLYKATLKDQTAGIYKTIDGEETEIVHTGQTVNFDIEASMPTIQSLWLAENPTDYVLNIEDFMSPAFSIVGESDAEKKSNIVLKYGEEEEEVLPSNLYSVAITTSRNEAMDWNDTKITITFDVSALMAWKKQENEILDIIWVHYPAKVTDHPSIGGDDNYNHAVFNFVLDPDGNLSKSESSAYGYCYGVDIYKLDGDTAGEVKPTYLPGAEFALYKEIAIPEESTLADYQNDTDYYCIDPTVEEGDEQLYKRLGLNDCGGMVMSQTENKPVYVTKGVPGEDRIIGISDGNYILVETKAPEGYKRLSEDMLFSIYPINPDDIESVYYGSYRYFADVPVEEQVLDQDGLATYITDDDGFFKIEVLNFQGFAMPNTGGMGTLIFTAIGVTVMLTVICVMINKRRMAKQ